MTIKKYVSVTWAPLAQIEHTYFERVQKSDYSKRGQYGQSSYRWQDFDKHV